MVHQCPIARNLSLRNELGQKGFVLSLLEIGSDLDIASVSDQMKNLVSVAE